MTTWRPKPSQIPASPGVYMFRDPKGRVIYVGKARSLRSRVSSYFGAGAPMRSATMVEHAGAVEWIVTSSEVEALQLEVSMIKQHQPRFNVRYRDDKSYPYLAVTTSEDYPRAMVMRGRKRKGDAYFGPYAHAYAIRETLDLLLRVFPIRSCSQGVFDRARSAGRPCLLFDIGRCAGPCVEAVSASEHRELVERFIAFMSGGQEEVVRTLRAQMDEAAENLEFEQAARIRDRLSAVDKVLQTQQMVTERAEDIDIIGSAGDELEAAFQVFFVRSGRVVGRRGFIVDRVEELTDPELMGTFIERLYGEQPPPREVLVIHEPPERAVIEQWLTEQRGAACRIRVPKRGNKRALLQTVQVNAQEAFLQARLKRASDFSARSRALNELQHALDLAEAPLRIECFDISNLGPTEVVGSMVVFEDGLPRRSDYRRFIIRGVEGQDDVASMGEVVSRRFARFLEEQSKEVSPEDRFRYQPSLVLIDGGRGQLNRAVQVMSDLGVVGIPVASIAKKFEEVFLPGEAEPRILPRGSEALYLLQRVRDEAHRFAVTYQRKRRKASVTGSELDRIPGVGPAKRRALIRKFGSVKQLAKASEEEIAEVPGIGPRLARQIVEHLRRIG